MSLNMIFIYACIFVSVSVSVDANRKQLAIFGGGFPVGLSYFFDDPPSKRSLIILNYRGFIPEFSSL